MLYSCDIDFFGSSNFPTPNSTRRAATVPPPNQSKGTTTAPTGVNPTTSVTTKYIIRAALKQLNPKPASSTTRIPHLPNLLSNPDFYTCLQNCILQCILSTFSYATSSLLNETSFSLSSTIYINPV